ncbi:3-hydroxyisobutyrate dehydrogenase [Ahrensia kielensis]|uniref:3-hydroxyisobutyrate dehydrogenase n=1 Tax=Ahrensia kielensis TaxID=76980 RepID=UPI003CCC8DEA
MIMRIGFIGLGNMGAPMAVNLAKAGHEVFGLDAAGATAEGVKQVQSINEAVTDMDCVITMLPNGQIVRDVCNEALEHMSSSSVLIDCSTIDIESARAVHAACASKNVLSVDAPVSGGVGGAQAGSLTFMAGGSQNAFDMAKPLLDIMGGKIVHCGEGGAGQAAKICNNMILGISMIGVCEAFALGEKLSLDPQKLFDVVSTSSGSCWSVNTYCPEPGVGPQSPADNDYKPGFAAELMLKDLLLSQSAAELVNADTPMGARAAGFYQKFVDANGRGRDFSAALEHFKSATRGDFDA